MVQKLHAGPATLNCGYLLYDLKLGLMLGPGSIGCARAAHGRRHKAGGPGAWQRRPGLATEREDWLPQVPSRAAPPRSLHAVSYYALPPEMAPLPDVGGKTGKLA